MRTTIPRPPDRDAWLDLRKPYIGASEAAALVGEHPYLTAGELAVEKLGHPLRQETSAMRRGIHLERAIADWWEEEHGIRLYEPDELYVCDDVLLATLDRRVEGANIGVEIKTSAKYVSEVPRYWYWQAQVQMVCAALEQVHVVVLDPRMDLQLFEVDPDPIDQGRIVELAAAFLDFIRDGEVPPDVILGYRAARALHPEVTEQAVELDADAVRWVGCLAALSARIKDLQADEDQLKGMISHRLGGAAVGRVGNREVVTFRQITRHDIDGKRLRAENPGLAREYDRTTTYRQLRVKD